jgi:hypothetical protein
MGVELRENADESRAGYRRKSGGRRSPVRIDYRKRVGKRARELSQYFTAAIVASGRELTVDLTERVMKASELTALAETMRAKMLRGEADVCADDLVRVTRLADTAVRRLALPSAASKPTPTLGDLLRVDHEQQMGRP